MIGDFVTWLLGLLADAWDWLVGWMFAFVEYLLGWAVSLVPEAWVEFLSGKNPETGSYWWTPWSDYIYFFNDLFPVKEGIAVFAAALTVVIGIRTVKGMLKLMGRW